MIALQTIRSRTPTLTSNKACSIMEVMPKAHPSSQACMSVKGKTLKDFPEIRRQWHPTKNGTQKKDEVAAGSVKKIWWKCQKGPDHEWNSCVYSVTKGWLTSGTTGCPFCAGQRPSVTNRLDTCMPHLLHEWHYEKNGALAPDQVVATSNRKVWWKCPMGPDHEWQAMLSERTRYRSGCPFCAGVRLSVTNQLHMVAPFLISEWDFERNRPLLPNQVYYGSTQQVWWRCSKGPDHVWKYYVRLRVKGAGCPFCSHARVSVTNSLATCDPKLAQEWHPTKNGKLTPAEVTPQSHQSVWWICRKNSAHEWMSPVANRSKGQNCPYCCIPTKRVTESNSLAALAPQVSSEWHPTRNGDVRPTDIACHSALVVWWKCPKGPDHEWQMSVQSRTDAKAKRGCPYCSGRRCSVTNSLATLHPAVAAQWHPKRNGKLKPHHVTGRSKLRVYWRCEVGHEWDAVIDRRIRNNSGCPHCARAKNRQVVTRKRREAVYMPSYEGRRAGPVKRIR